MRQRFVAIVAAIATVGLAANTARADKVEVKGPHVCCMRCVTVIKGFLGKVEGVSDVQAAKDAPVTFTAKDEKAAVAGVKALIDNGFFGTATRDGKELKVDAAAAKSEKADTVTVKDVHSCCKLCRDAITGLFKEAKVTFEGAGPQQTVKIEGKDLDKAKVLEALRKTGFNGKVE